MDRFINWHTQWIFCFSSFLSEWCVYHKLLRNYLRIIRNMEIEAYTSKSITLSVTKAAGVSKNLSTRFTHRLQHWEAVLWNKVLHSHFNSLWVNKLWPEEDLDQKWLCWIRYAKLFGIIERWKILKPFWTSSMLSSLWSNKQTIKYT